LPAITIFLLIALLLGACTASAHDDVVIVAAASDLAAAMPDLIAAFEANTGTTVTVTLGASGQFASQIAAGAPVDVFLSADASLVDRLEADGRVEPGTRAVYAHGALAVLAASGTALPQDVASLADLRFARIAIANPEHAPYGRAAVAALHSAGIYDVVASRLVLADNVRQTIQFVESGGVDVAVTARALMDSSRHRWIIVPSELHPPLMQTAVVVRGSANADAARGFVAFMTGAEGRAILQRFNFTLP
jgi:molybdate transport system substrate-binding protein